MTQRDLPAYRLALETGVATHVGKVRRANEDAAVADEIVSILMGEDVESRKHFIQTNAKDVRFLDI